MLVGHHDLAAVPDFAQCGASLPFVEVAILRDAVTRQDFAAVQTAPGDQIDDARDRIGAVDCRSAVRDDLDTIDAERRQDRRIDRSAVADCAVAVDQDKRGVRTDAPQVHAIAERDVAVAARLAAGAFADAEVEDLGDFLDDPVDRHRAGSSDLIPAQCCDCRAYRRGSADPASGYDNRIGRG